MAMTALTRFVGMCVEGNDLALGTVLATEERGDHLRLELVGVQALTTSAVGGDRADLADLEANGHGLGAWNDSSPGITSRLLPDSAKASDGGIALFALLAVAGTSR